MVVQRQSETVLRILDSSQAVEDSVTVQGPRIAAILEQRLEPRIEALVATGELEDGRPVYRAILFTLRDELAASREELSAVELRHIDLKAQITVLSVEREELQDELSSDYTFLRGNLEKRDAGRKVSAQAGLQGPTAQKASRLLRQVRVAVFSLSKPGLEIPEDRLAAFGFDLEGTVARLKAKATSFARLLRRLRLLKRELQMSQDEKDEAVERHRNIFVPVTRTLEGYYRLAGKHRLADQIRPSEVQRGRRAVEVEDSPETVEGQVPDGQPNGASAVSASAPSAGSAPPSPEGRPPAGVESGDPPAPAVAVTPPTDAGSSDA